MNRNAVSTTISVALTAACAATAVAQTAIDRTTLPIHEPQYPHSTVLDVRNATPPPPRFAVKAPAQALKLNYLCGGLKTFYVNALPGVERIAGALWRVTAQSVRRM